MPNVKQKNTNKILLNLRDVERLTGLTTSTIRKYRELGEFPKGRIVCGKYYWHADIIKRWIETFKNEEGLHEDKTEDRD